MTPSPTFADAAHRSNAVAAALLLASLVACSGAASVAGASDGARPRNLTRFVNPFTGTDAALPDFGTGGSAGNTFPGASAPFGMLQWSPDTVPSSVNFGGLYSYGDTQVRGFSLTHLSGVGCPIMGDLPFLPTTTPILRSPAVANSYAVHPDYIPSFRHRGERAQPGYYRVWLDRRTPRAIKSELTATTRSGLARFRYPSTSTASVLINAGGSAMANGDAVFAIDPERREVSGWVESGQFCYARNRYRVFFAAEFDRPFTAYGTWQRQDLAPGATSSADHADQPFHLRPVTGLPNPPTNSNGAQAGAYVTFDATDDRVVQVRVGVSFVSVANARENLRAESLGWDFPEARRATRATWNDMLDRLRVRGGSRRDKRTFYTMLYHALLGPNVFSDVNGEYMGMDGQVHSTDGFTQYANVSGWDVYRSQIPLVALLAPERASDIVQSLLTNARESGWLPKWPVAAAQTNVMVGDAAAPIIAGAYALGARNFDHLDALDAMIRGATEVGTSPNAEYVERAALPDYVDLGYVPHDGTELSSGASTSIFGSTDAVWGSAATTLEYATADFAIARFAAALGDSETCHTFMQRSGNWRNLFNPASAHVQPRYADGTFTASFDPASGEGFAEGSAAQYTWMVPHDLAGLAAALGGAASTALRLDAFFSELNAGPHSVHAFLGNEPNALTPWIYNWIGRPYRTQELVRRTLLTLFDATPAGYPGNDDVGQMSAWYVLGAIGLYPVIPGTDVLALGSPLFRWTDVELAGGTLTIMAPDAARGRPYVHELTINGSPHIRPWIGFDEIDTGGTMEYRLASSAEPSWGADAADAPPSFAPAGTGSCPP